MSRCLYLLSIFPGHNKFFCNGKFRFWKKYISIYHEEAKYWNTKLDSLSWTQSVDNITVVYLITLLNKNFKYKTVSTCWSIRTNRIYANSWNLKQYGITEGLTSVKFERLFSKAVNVHTFMTRYMDSQLFLFWPP